MQQLNRLLKILCDAEIPFVVVGGFAGMLHGSSLVTRDLDVCSVLTDENIAKLREALRDLHPFHRISSTRTSFMMEPEAGSRWNHLYLQTDLGPLDILSSITGVGDFKRVSANAVEIRLLGRDIRIMSIDDLIAAKEALGRDKDNFAATELRAAKVQRMTPSTALLVVAITERRRLSFDYNGKERLVEPQCYGFGRRGTELLRAHQIKGGEQREPLFDVRKMTNLRLLDDSFSASGPNYKKNDSAMAVIFAQL